MKIFFTRRPPIGDFVMVSGYMSQPFKARVIDYFQCGPESIRVRRAHTTDEEWVVAFCKCYEV